MQKNRIANTDIEVSLLGLGTVKLGRNTAVKYPQSFTIPDDQQALTILNAAMDSGINLIDTAPAYGNSETRLGTLLPKTDYPWVICTKVGEIFDSHTGQSSYNFTPEYIQSSIENSLRRLGKESLDIVLIHSNGEDEAIIKSGAIECLNHYKKKGLIKATGMSTKTVKGGMLTVDQADVVMVTHNLAYQEEAPVIAYAHQNNKGVLIKKALASGHSAHNTETDKKDKEKKKDSVTESFQCIFKEQGVSSIVLGSINPEHISNNAEKAIKAYQNRNK